MVLLYWQIGRDILTRQEQEGWGAKVIDRLAADLRRAFPDMTGLSPRNLKYMRAFAAAWPDEPIVQQAAAQIPWFHNCVLLDKVEEPERALWYIRKTIENGWSRDRPRPLDRERSLRAAGQGHHQFRQEPPAPAIRPGQGNAERPVQI